MSATRTRAGEFLSLEHELLAWLRENLPTSGRHLVGLGDDAAVLAGFDSSDVVVTTDMLTDGVDFLLEQVDPSQVGHKALGVNLSDLAAMAAEPVAAFVSLVLPRQGCQKLSPLELAIQLYRGMLPLAESVAVEIAGGDTNTWDGPLAISITAIGKTISPGPLTRSGGQAGDQLLVTGTLGGSILGRHLQVEPRVREALQLHSQYELHAAIDVSDGLALDAARLAEASQLGVILDLDTIPISDAAQQLAQRDGQSALEHALGDGEDFELVFAVPPQQATQILSQQPLEVPIARIGQLIETRGLWQATAGGKRKPLTAHGYQHRDHETGKSE